MARKQILLNQPDSGNYIISSGSSSEEPEQEPSEENDSFSFDTYMKVSNPSDDFHSVEVEDIEVEDIIEETLLSNDSSILSSLSARSNI